MSPSGPTANLGEPRSGHTSGAGRVAVLGAFVVVVVVLAMILLSSRTTYQVRAIFQNASQIVSGDLVEVAGNSVGTVTNIALTPNGQAQLTLGITDEVFDPLREGTTATVREVSQSGIASRYVDLNVGSANRAAIRDGGVIPTQQTTSEVDLDELYNTLNRRARKGLQDVFQGSASQYQGQGAAAQLAWQYLNPAVASASVLFGELNRDPGALTGFIVNSSHLVSDLAHRQADLSGVITHLGMTEEALAAQPQALGESLRRLPGFMRLANTTFVNLRGALDDLTPLVNDSKPVAPKLQQLLEQLRPLAQDAVPTVHALSNVVSRPGANNDLTELTALGVPLAGVTVRNVRAGGRVRPGAFPQSTIALNESTPELATDRPYAVDLTGWFEGFSHPGNQDAAGGTNRTAGLLGASNLATAVANGLVQAHQGDRCPGSMERGGLFFPHSGYPCTASQVPPGK